VYKLEGLPQGAPFSAILSILGLETAFFQPYDYDRPKVKPGFARNLLMYAGDGLVYSDKQSGLAYPPLAFGEIAEDLNISLAPEKSGQIKLDGKWLRPLKFLGVQYVPASWRESDDELFWVLSLSFLGLLFTVPLLAFL